MSFLSRLLFCLVVFSLFLYSYIEKQNALTYLKMEIPALEKELLSIREENRRLVYEIDAAEHPIRLIELAHREEYRHLRHPLVEEVLTLPEGLALSQ